MKFRHCLIVFLKYPEIGGVKSRLAATIGERHASYVYRQFVYDLLDSLTAENYGLRLFFSPPDRRCAITEWLGSSLSYEPQTGDDLGERMKNAFEKSFADGFRSTILIGSDIPDLPAEIIDQGFAALKGDGCVIGPSFDGGYYLIGFKAETFSPDVFADIPWSTDNVLNETRRVLEKQGRSIALLPSWRDVDGYEDLIALMERNRHTAFAQSRTIRYILSHRLASFSR